MHESLLIPVVFKKRGNQLGQTYHITCTLVGKIFTTIILYPFMNKNIGIFNLKRGNTRVFISNIAMSFENTTNIIIIILILLISLAKKQVQQ